MIQLVCLHGFLGLATDWNFLKSEIQSSDIKIHAIDLWQSFSFHRPDSLKEWAKEILNEISFLKESDEKSVNNSSNRDRLIVLGYSLGGRLAAQMLSMDTEKKIDLGICVAGHLGLEDEAEKKQRLKSDQMWAERFFGEPWAQIIQDWNAQDVFRGSQALNRQESDFNRQILAQVLDFGSLGRQEYLVNSLRNDERLQLIVGQKDLKYLNLMEGWKTRELPKSQVDVITGAGHRVPWDQQNAFVRHLRGVLQRVQGRGDA